MGKRLRVGRLTTPLFGAKRCSTSYFRAAGCLYIVAPSIPAVSRKAKPSEDNFHVEILSKSHCPRGQPSRGVLLRDYVEQSIATLRRRHRSSRPTSIARAVRHAVGAQPIESHRLAPRQNAQGRAGLRSQPVRRQTRQSASDLCAAKQRCPRGGKHSRVARPRRSAGKVGQSHHAVPRHRQRRQARLAGNLSHWFEHARRHAAAGQLVLRRQHRRRGSLSLSRRPDEDRRQRRKDSRSAGRRPSHAHAQRRSGGQENLRRHRLRIQRRRRKRLGKRSTARRNYRNQSRRQRHADIRQRAAQSRRHGLGTQNQDSLDRRQ